MACRQLRETARPGTSGQAHREGSVRWAEAGAVSCGGPASPCAESTAEGERDPVPVPSRLGNLHPIVSALKDDERRHVMPSGLRRRSMLLLRGLSAEAVRRGYEVRKAHSFFHPREGGVDIAVLGLAYTVGVRQEFPQSMDPDRSSRLVVELAHGLTDRPGRWRDRKTRALEGGARPSSSSTLYGHRTGAWLW